MEVDETVEAGSAHTGQKQSSGEMYQRIVSNTLQPYYYMSVDMEFEDGNMPDITDTQFKAIILHAVKVIFGEVGQASIKVDVIKFIPGRLSAVLRVNDSGFTKLWSALTLLSEYDHRRCAVRVHQVSGSLIALAANSRTFRYKPVELAT